MRKPAPAPSGQFLSRAKPTLRGKKGLLGTAGAGRAHDLGALVLDADERQSLVSIRSLGRAGVHVGALESRPGVPAFSSRWCTVSGVVPSAGVDSDAFVDAVIDWVERYSPRALICATDGSVAALRRRRGDIERRAKLALASEKALDIAVSKQRTLALAAQLGIRVPRAVTLMDPADLPAATEEVGFPLVVKPTDSWVPRGSGGTRLTSRLVVNLDEAARAIEAVQQSGCSVILQEWLSGSREAISLFRARGRIWARFAQLATRMHPPLGGSSVTRMSISLPPDITPVAERLVEAADLDGYSEIEFRRDSAGQAALMEINPRLSASVEVAVRAGVNFPLLLYAWAAGGSLHTVLGYRVGLRMRWLGGDLRWLLETLRTQGRPDVEPAGKAFVHFLGDFLRPARYDYLAISDLRPAMVASAAFTRRIVGGPAAWVPQPLRGEEDS